MFRALSFGLVFLGLCGGVMAQGMMGDVMSGKLVNPEVGAFALYSLKDTATGKEFFLRQAIVGSERVKRKEAFWLETELVPRVGFSSVYKMLLTGPARDPDNVHRLLVREGNGVVQEVQLDGQERGGANDEVPRTLVGTEDVSIADGTIEAEHFVLGGGDEATDLWISEKVPPMGLVKMTTPQGELTLQRYGTGGKYGESAISTPPASAPESETAPEADRGKENESVRRNFNGRGRGKR